MNYKQIVKEFVDRIIKEINPYDVVCECLKQHHFSCGDIYVVAIGKAAYTMGLAARDTISNIKQGVVISKYGHIKSDIKGFKTFEAGHPISDENTIEATNYALNMCKDLKKEDEVIFLISGGGSALFESPKVPLDVIQDINKELLRSGANINEINTIRKRLSNVKAGRFALHCAPAKVTSIILSDVIGDDLCTIASGPSVPDTTSSRQALEIINKYHLEINDEVKDLLKIDTPTKLDNIETHIIGSVSLLCDSGKKILEDMGYKTCILASDNTDEASIVGHYLGGLAIAKQGQESLAYIIGGETVVKVKGNGIGGRNQELALSACKYLSGLTDTCLLALGSDGTDGPTDMAGGFVDDKSMAKARELNIDVDAYLDNNDSFHCLEKLDGLIYTGPTGTNVNDIYVLLIGKGNRA